MGRFFEALKAGVKGFKEANNPTGFSVDGKPVRCPHCGGSEFAISSVMLNSRGRTAFGVDWADPSASILICAECGRIEWYAQEPTEISN
jgi:predicted nucleic-acid-binding Zn-ribbon protein